MSHFCHMMPAIKTHAWFVNLVGADLEQMGKISSHHMMRFMIVLMQWDCKRTSLEESMLTVCQIRYIFSLKFKFIKSVFNRQYMQLAYLPCLWISLAKKIIKWFLVLFLNIWGCVCACTGTHVYPHLLLCPATFHIEYVKYYKGEGIW